MTTTAVTAAALALVVAMTPVGVAAAQERGQPTLPRSVTSAAAAQRAALQAAAGQAGDAEAAAAAQTSGIVDDPVGDVQPSQLAAADITAAGLTIDDFEFGPSTVRVTIPGNDLSDPNWAREGTFIEWQLDTTQDLRTDFVVRASSPGDGSLEASMFDRDGNLLCAAGATRESGGVYSVALCRLSFGGANARVSAAFFYDNGSDVFVDRAPDAGFSEPVPDVHVADKPAARLGNVWHLRYRFAPGPADLTFAYGRADDFPLMCDWDGDGVKTPGVVRGNTWYLRNWNSAGPANVTFNYGTATDHPVCGDWDGDGIDTPGVFRGNTWYLRNSTSGGGANLAFGFGRSTDFPIVGDWWNLGFTAVGVVRGTTWYMRAYNPADNTRTFHYGTETDLPVAGRWVGDIFFFHDLPGVVRGRTWLLRRSFAAGPADITFTYGPEGCTPLVWR